MANFFQIQPNAVMPIGVTPTVLVLWFPFAFLARFDLPLAQTLWVSSSLAVLIFALLKTYLFLCAYKRSLLPIYFIVLCIFVSSFTTVAAILLGQTGILASGLLILLVIEINQANNAGRPLRRMLVYAMIFLLTIKIPYLVAGIGLLFIFGFIYESIVSGTLMVIALLLLSTWLDFDMIIDWFDQLAIYLASEIPGYYASSIYFPFQITFRSAFSSFIGNSLAVTISQIVLFIACLTIFAISFLRYLNQSSSVKVYKKVTSHQLAVTLLAILLLFLPYLVMTEELLLIVPFIILLLEIGHLKIYYLNIIIFIFLTVILNRNLLPDSKPVWPFWLIKLAVLYYFWFALRIKRQESLPAEGRQGGQTCLLQFKD